MRHLAAAAAVATFLGVGVPAVTLAAPVAPFASQYDATSQVQPGVEEVRWVRRCRWVRQWRFGRLVRVERCRRVWVAPRRYPPPYGYPRY
jgi:hypothetical protein